MAIFTKNAGIEATDRCNFISVLMEQYPFIFSDLRKHRLQRHLAFWGFWWLFQAFLYSFIPLRSISSFTYWSHLPIAALESFLYLPSHIFLAYSLMYFVIPRYLIRGKYVISAIWVLILFLSAATISSIIGRNLLVPVRTFVFPYSSVLPYPNTQQVFFLSLLAGLRGGITIGGIAAAIKLMKYWYVKEQRNLQLQKENVESQLQLLKAQVHPHFLFNTLNNIYSFTQNSSPVASELVTRLSDMLRFILYEANHPLVPLSKEIKLVEDYINLERVRYGNMLDVHIDTPGNTHDLHIAPLLLLPLVENCFKHGTSQILEHPWISLQVKLQGREMHMKLMNGKTDLLDEKKHAHGIGIQNVVKRLSLIYPGRHEFFVTSDEDVYIVNLKIIMEQKKDSSVKTITTLEPAHA